MIKIGTKELKYPIVQGGMGIGISLGGLAGAVAKSGGMGTISAAQIGFRDPEFEKDPVTCNLKAMEAELQKARKIAPDGVIGFNIMVAMNHYEDYVRQAVRLGADFIVSGAGLPVDLPAYVVGETGSLSENPSEYVTGEPENSALGDSGVEENISLIPIISSQKAARVLLKFWENKYHRTADAVVIEGPKAGGHLGFQRKQLESLERESYATYEEEIKKILETVREYEKIFQMKIPVILGGGISSREEADHAFSLGADAIQVATRFVTTKECDTDPAYKEAYLKAEKSDIVLTKSPVGMPGRAIRNSFLKQVESGIKFPPEKCMGCLKKCNPKDIPYCITEALIHAAKGDVEEGLLFCGADVWKTERIQTVPEVFRDLLGDRTFE